MSQSVECCTKSFTAGEAIAKDLLVRLNGLKIEVCQATETPIGVAQNAAFADGDVIPVRLLSTQGTIKVTCGAGVAAGAVLYAINSGKVDDADPTSGVKCGYSLEAGDSGDVIEMLPALQL